MAQLDSQSHRKLIRIRPYRPSDSEQVRELFKAGILPRSNSLMGGAQLRGPTACLSYCVLVLGLLLVTFPTTPRTRYIGIALSVVGLALFAALRYTFSYAVSGFINEALNGDLKDIGKSFGIKAVVDDNGERTGEYVPSGTSGFWVAEAYEKGSEIVGDSRTEIIGSIGLDANKNSDKTTAELRRMLVSPNYRRRGIAISLIKKALHHAQNYGVKSVVLSTTMLQPAAIAMYENFGWVRQKKEVGVRIMLDRMRIFNYSLDLSTIKL